MCIWGERERVYEIISFPSYTLEMTELVLIYCNLFGGRGIQNWGGGIVDRDEATLKMVEVEPANFHLNLEQDDKRLDFEGALIWTQG